MTKKGEESEDYPIDYYPYDDEFSDSDRASLCDDNESSDPCCIQPHEQITFDDVKIRPVLMKRLKLGNAILHVFSNGAICTDSIGNTSRGFALAGTPYRTYTVEYGPHDFRTYYVHELVWRAFRGNLPEGWEVRHKSDYTIFAHKTYSNALHHLDMYPTLVTKLI